MSPRRLALSTLGCALLALVCRLPSGPAQMPPAPPADTGAFRGEKVLTDPGSVTAGTRWALIVGTNYTGVDDKEAHPSFNLRLKNAENDAQKICDLLKEHYGYKDENVRLLKGPQATRDALVKNLSSEWLNSPAVHKEDSVLVFFAGHGDQLDSSYPPEGRGVIYPHDVKFQKQKPTLDSVLRLKQDLLDYLRSCRAEHKLLILDSCYSGEIFLGAQPRSEPAASRPALAAQPSFQVIASCRAGERAADGRDGNSPFTSALLRGLELLPTQPDTRSAFTATRLFQFMSYELRGLPNTQNPDCRSFIDSDGEFLFSPAGEFKSFLTNSTDFTLLRAMVPGEYGNWWFDETPWLIPSLRQDILDKKTGEQRSAIAEEMSKYRLRRSAEQEMQTLATTPGPLAKMRLDQLKSLLDAEKGDGFEEQLTRIAGDLKKAWHPEQDRAPDQNGAVPLQATDLHLLAILQHKLLEKDAQGHLAARETYRAALDRYKEEQRPESGQNHKALEALCWADFGYFDLDVQHDSGAAGHCFRQARALYPSDAPPPFTIFTLCREADAWQRQGRWGYATDRLKWAIHVATYELDPQHPLTAHAHQRLADLYLEQWKMREAIEEFEKARKIVAARLPPGFFEQADAPAPAPDIPENNSTPENSSAPRIDYEALLLTFHSLAGEALADRFLDHPQRAAEEYRALGHQVRKAFATIREGTALQTNVSEVKQRLLECLVEVRERLADCNLFSDEATRSLTEAGDDLRLVKRLCYLLPRKSRDRIQAGLLYKQALVAALQSRRSRDPQQDLKLAQDYCRAAAALKPAADQANAIDPRTFVPLIVTLLAACRDGPDALDRNGVDKKRLALEQLRAALEKSQEELSQNAQRDHLEFLMFAGKVLVEECDPADRYHLLEDSELLLGFCRKALISRAGPTGSYLRQYYDTVIEAKTRQEPQQVKDLLEAVYEATRGEPYAKPKELSPVLALYVLRGRCHLFLDVPQVLGGTSKHFLLDEDYTPEQLRAALQEPGKRPPLPREVVKELVKVKAVAAVAQPSAPVTLECWWEDPLVRLTPPSVAGATSDAVVTTAGKGGVCLFPFKLPEGIEGIDLPALRPPAVVQVRKP